MRRDKEILPVKLYYRIGEVAGLVGVEPHVLRYWESEFPTIRPQKSRSGQRVYSRRDVETLMRVKDLLYAQRFTIAGARQRMRTGSTEALKPELHRDTESAPSTSATAGGSTEPLKPEVGRHSESALSASVSTMTAALEPSSPPCDGAPIHSDVQRMRSALLALRARIAGLLESVDVSRANNDPIR